VVKHRPVVLHENFNNHFKILRKHLSGISREAAAAAKKKGNKKLKKCTDQ
jgi:hypothetical protein